MYSAFKIKLVSKKHFYKESAGAVQREEKGAGDGRQAGRMLRYTRQAGRIASPHLLSQRRSPRMRSQKNGRSGHPPSVLPPPPPPRGRRNRYHSRPPPSPLPSLLSPVLAQ